ncbi:MAG TPA: alpha-glucosidase family protein, partial [Gammaproteobacteria bacterium]|nr:alpha-glucosidase family protein [Gammaproteobacteria bacterium]
PMKDFGYDVSDYTDVDPMFGGIPDFDHVIAEAHRLGLRVMIDQVPSHSSDQHPWFQESRASRDNPRADWYVWADARDDGTPPNNWLSVFGGPAWQWDTGRCQYYLHNFLPSQPDLNYHNPEVLSAMLDCMRFWLDRGVDGFRLDAINFSFHDPRLRDNPAAAGVRETFVSTPENPYSYQQHLYDKSRPEMLGFLRRIRALADEYGDVVLMGEIGDDRSRELMSEYTSGGDRLHMAYSFDLLTERRGAAHVRDRVEGLEQAIGDGYPCWSIGNHDVQRVATRWGGGVSPERVAPLYAAMLLSLRGGICLYQGDELGLTEAELAFEQLQDPYGINMWPTFKGRDGCRTPMPWAADVAHGGFSTATPWLPVPEEHLPRAVDRQESDDRSTLNRVRRFIGWRHAHPALAKGDILFLDAPEDVLLFERGGDTERILCAFNLEGEPVEVPLPGHADMTALDGHGFGGRFADGTIHLDGYDAFFGLAGR